MTLLAGLSLTIAMLALAALPSASVALVVTRSATLGFRNGVATAAGIVAGDILLATFAILGMGFLAAKIGPFFVILKYAGGAYLIWFGIKLLLARKIVNVDSARDNGLTLLASFISGLLLTLGDVKAILFYASLFPSFIDMTVLSLPDIAGVVLVIMLAVGGVKLVYAFAATRIVSYLQAKRTMQGLRIATGGLMIGTGAYVVVKA